MMMAKETEAKDIQDIFGEFGRWHLTIASLCFTTSVVSNWNAFGFAFFAFPMNHWCARTDDFQNLSVSEWINLSIPFEPMKGKLVPSKCFMYDLANYSSDGNWTPTEKVSCREWEFDRSFFKDSIVDEFNLVCKNAWLISLSQSIYMAGFLVAVAAFGQLADRIGRRPVALTSLVVLQASGVAMIFSNSYAFFAAMRFFAAMGAHGLFTVGFVVMMEIAGPRHRSLMVTFMNFGWGIGFLVLPGLGWLTRSWYYLQIVIAASSSVLLLYWWLLPESPRWLITQRKYEKAAEVIQKGAERNGKWTPDTEIACRLLLERIDNEQKNVEKKNYTLVDLLRTPNMRKKTLIMFYAWFVTSFVYYGLSLNTGSLGGDAFTNFAIAASADLPAFFVAYLVIRYIGRKIPLATVLTIAGLSCLITIGIGDDLLWLRITFAMVGKAGAGIAFALVYTFSAEIFPTVVRNVGVGMSSTSARVGSVIAPFIKELGKATNRSVPLGIFGGLTLIGALLVLLLPDTFNQKIPDTLEEAEEFGKKKKTVKENTH